MKTFAQFLNLMEDVAPPPPAGGPPGGAAPPMGGPPPGGPPMGGPPMGGPPMGGPPGGAPGGPAPGGQQAPMKLKSTNVWDVLERYLSGGQGDQSKKNPA